MLCNGVWVCGFEQFVKDRAVPKRVEAGNRCELYALSDAARFYKAFGSRAVEMAFCW